VGFASEMKATCPSCTYRLKNLPIATVNTTAPSLVVSDLQRHPDTNVAAFSSNEMSTGLPAAMTTAGLKVDVVGSTPTPANLQDIKDGKQAAALALDLPVYSWTMIDMAARSITGQPLTENEQAAFPPVQFLERKDITFDPSKGYTAYPDFAQRFIKLWRPSG
jgi:ribose transport system substrate-binding protein